MMHKAWCNIEEVPYNFSGSSIQFWGHTGWKIDVSNPIWVRLLGRSQLSNPSDLPCFVTSEAIRQWSSWGRNHEWKSLLNRLKSDEKSIFTVTQIHYFISYMPFYVLMKQINPLKQSLIAHLVLWRHHSSICYITQTQGTGILMSY